MKKNILKAKLFSGVVSLALLLGGMFGFSGCSEEIDESNFAIKTEQTIADYLTDNAEFSDMKALCERVRLGNEAEASSVFSALSARGNYTVFLPDNDAVADYLATKGKTDVSELTDEEAQLVVYSCIIDNVEQSAYESADFPSPGAFALPNLNDRLLTCLQDEEGILINGVARVVNADVELSNGMVHQVGTVIAPSSDKLYELIGRADNMKFMSYLLNQTHWTDSLVAERDEEYEGVQRELTYYQSGVVSNKGNFKVPQHRYLGFSGFVEPDAVFAEELGVTLDYNEEGDLTDACKTEMLSRLQQRCSTVYSGFNDADLKSPNNAVNRFVSYHFVKGKMSYDRMVAHYNEYDYGYDDGKNPQRINCPLNVWDYYTTMGEHRGLLKVTQVGDQGFEGDTDHKVYLNRISVYDNEQNGNYRETGVVDAGILISAENGNNDNNAQNGFYYPINKILFYSPQIREKLGAERIRVDLVTMLPEMQSGNFRGGEHYSYPLDFFENIIVTQAPDMHILYLHEAWSGAGGNWRDFQGDEMLMTGLYDFILRLPPVPTDGMYEVRMGVSANPLRGMCQVYFGEGDAKDTKNLDLPPVGLPFDMRLSAGSVSIPWADDSEIDVEQNIENDKNMRNQGYMKGPKYMQVAQKSPNTGAENNLRKNASALRRIIVTYDMKADRTYYMRFKTALKKTDSQFFIDYFEFVPTTIYNGPEPEDIW